MLFTSLAHLCVRVAAQAEFEPLRTVAEFCSAIADMHVRGAGCIGVTAGYGMYCAAVQARKDAVQRGEGTGRDALGGGGGGGGFSHIR